MSIDSTLSRMSGDKSPSSIIAAVTTQALPTARKDITRAAKQRVNAEGRDAKKHLKLVRSISDISVHQPRVSMPVLGVDQIRLRVLLVESADADRQACRLALQQNASYGVELMEAATGRDGLSIALQQSLDCIILSYHLPDMGGKEFLDEMRKSTQGKSVPVIKMTCVADAVGGIADGDMQDCLIKDEEWQYLKLLPSLVKKLLDNQRRVQSELQVESMYRTLVEHIPAITYAVSLQHGRHMFYISPQVKLLGFTPEAWLANPDLRFQRIHEEDRDLVVREFNASSETGSAFNCNYRFCCGNGEYRWFNDTASVVLDSLGHPLYMQGVVLDITETRTLELELDDHRRRMEKRVMQRTEQMERRIAILEAANSSLCGQLASLRENCPEYRS